jgi:iron-sulfur cluster insertion protein
MNKVIISDEAYTEFKGFLDENKVESYNIRINFAGNSCSGPAFNISIEDSIEAKKENDIVEQVKDINFIVEKALIDEFDGFTILSTEENNGRGLSLRPLTAPEGGCSSCPGCH